jgi:dTDP-4-amino-4,6-dideoxygalactose transaminase
LEYKIPFNKPYVSGNELSYISNALSMGKISGNGYFTNLCHEFFENKYDFKKVLLTNSCTDALEMAAILLDIVAEDEVILPSFTFVSTANAFILRGAKLVFCDSENEHPNIDAKQIESLITQKTKAIVVVHYAGISCDMISIMEIAKKHNLFVIEDAAQAINSFHISEKGDKRALGSFGDLATFSFHETKNIISGEGGMLVINNENLIPRAEIIWEKGTNRKAFSKGEVSKYDWVDIGSSFLPSEMIAAYLWAQLENIDKIQNKRCELWNNYNYKLKNWAEINDIQIASIPKYSSNNGHIFYLVCVDEKQRNELIEHLRKNKILAVFHYQSLHRSHFFKDFHDGRKLINSDKFSDCLLRMPMFYELDNEEVIECLLMF